MLYYTILCLVVFDFDYKTDQDCLIGEVIHEVRNRVVGFRFIDRSELSMKPEERFLQLFTIESEWSQEELVPYIEYSNIFYSFYK